MRILVTGAAGFIGRHLVEELHQNGHVVATTDIQPGAGDQRDLTSSDECFRLMGEYDPDVVVHLAAQVGRVFGEDDLAHTINANAVATANLARAVGETGKRMTYVSTSEVYGDRGEYTCYEGDQLRLPHNLYGLSKYWGEQACELYAPEGLQIIRLSMPYGTGVVPGRGRAALNNVLWQAVTGQRIPIHRGAERSWCWVGDTVAGICLVIERGEQRTGETVEVTGHAAGLMPLPVDMPGDGIYNIGRDDDPVPMLELARMACDLVGVRSHDLIELVDAPNNQTVVKRLSTDKLRGLGWTPRVELAEGMKRVLEHVKQYDRDANLITQKVPT